MIWLIIAIFGSLGFLQTVRWMQQRQVNLPVGFLVNYAAAATFFATSHAITRPAVDTSVALTGLVTGILYVCNIYVISTVIRRIGIALSGCVLSLSVTVPVIASIAYGDPWRSQLPGLTLALLALPLLATARAGVRHPHTRRPAHRRLLWVLICFCAVGAEGTLLKTARQLGDATYQWTFLPALFCTAAVVATIPVLLSRVRRPTRADVRAGLILGSFNILANYAATQAVLHLAGPVVFPIRQMGMVLGATVLGWLWWREHLSRRALLGITLTLLATCALALPALLK